MTSFVGALRGANHIADALELTALAKETALGPAALSNFAQKFRLSQADLALASRAIQQRSELLGEAYPFRTAAGSVAATDGAPHTAWAALLSLGVLSPVRSERLADAAVLFEEFTCRAVRGLFGPETQSLRFGWPSDVGRPRAFPDAIRWLADRMGVAVGAAFRPPATKDGGVDVVAWRPFADGRSGFPVALVQCTLEKEFAHKAADIDLRVWSGWLRLDSPPVSILAVPEVVGAGQEWDSLASRVVVLDRIRLVGLLEALPRDEDLMQSAGAWVSECASQVLSAMLER